MSPPIDPDEISTMARPSARNVQAHHDKWQATWNRDCTRDRMARMTKHIFPTLGDRDTITARDIFSAVNPIWGQAANRAAHLG
jgi:hypothetical protein